MSGKGDCRDNASMENFWGTLRTELVHHQKFKTRLQAKQEIVEYIESFITDSANRKNWTTYCIYCLQNLHNDTVQACSLSDHRTPYLTTHLGSIWRKRLIRYGVSSYDLSKLLPYPRTGPAFAFVTLPCSFFFDGDINCI